MSRFGRGLGALIAAAALSAGAVTPAAAGAPHRTNDTVTAVFVEASNGSDRTLDLTVMRSDVAGTFAFATLRGPGGDQLATGYGTSEWKDAVFRAEVELFDDDGVPAGRVAIGGTYAQSGAADRNTQKFNDGNIHVLMNHTTTALAVSDVTVSVEHADWAVLSGEGFHETGYLFVSDPATFVGREDRAEFGAFTAENVADFFVEGSLDELGIDIDFADAEAHAGGGIDLSNGTWNGTLRLFDDEGETLGEVTATATLTSTDRTVRFFDRVRGGYEKWSFTPYELVVTVDGPVAPARLTIEVAEIQHSVHTSPIG